MPSLAKQYELVYIVHPNISDDAVQGVIAKYNNIITTQGGTLERTDIWERRRLAYEIKGQTEGIYIVSLFRGLSNVADELRRVFRISEDTLRSIIVSPDEEIDANLPSVQPRDFAAPRPMPQGQGQGAPGAPQQGGMIQPNAPASVQATAAAVEDETPTSGDTPGAAAGTSTSIAAAAEAADVPGMAAADEGQEAEGTPNPVEAGA